MAGIDCVGCCAVRDPALLEFCLKSHNFCDAAWNLIYYTGKAELDPAVTECLPPNIRIFKQRPDLHVLIPSIVSGRGGLRQRRRRGGCPSLRSGCAAIILCAAIAAISSPCGRGFRGQVDAG